jgi:tRNA A-37 threonylcarbamoyl transferase component Bud32
MTRPFVTAIVVVVLAAVYMVLQVWYVRPHLWPAGDGIRVGAMTAAVMLGRAPALDANAGVILGVLPGSPANVAGVRAGDVFREIVDLRTSQRVDAQAMPQADAGSLLRIWRDVYRTGMRDPLRVVVHRPSEGRDVRATYLRPAAWRLPRDIYELWAKVHVSDLLQIVVFVVLSVVLLALRATDPSAALVVLSLSLCAVAAGGPTLGSEYLLPVPLQQVVTIFSWIATPLAFVATAFAIGYFPRKAPRLVRQPLLLVVPFVVTAPMFIVSMSTALFLLGFDTVLPIITWDLTQPWFFFGSFAAAVLMNVAIVAEAVHRFKTNPDRNEQRRIAISVVTIVPGVLAYAIKDGVPGIGFLLGRNWMLPWWLTLILQIVVLLPAFGITYAVAVNRVFAPATVLRRSVQYALARKTLGLLAALPATALIVSLVEHRDMSLSMLIRQGPLFDIAMIAAIVAVIKYRDRARLWLDRRFFREAYDAREILLSLASRITYETDPSELTTMVVDRIDTALHPEMAAVLVAGVDEGQLRPVSTMRAAVPPLRLDSGLITMLRWSAEPLELYVTDERSPARRLPASDQEWLQTTGAVLFVPVMARASESSTQTELTGLIALGVRRSEEPYTAEDRQLLASIAAQVSLALDVVRLRQRADLTIGPSADAAQMTVSSTPVAPGLQAAGTIGSSECPQCGRCDAPDVTLCVDEVTRMRHVEAIPHVVDKKYRMDRVIGRGGMGAVYRARDVRLDRDVAIKVVRADLLNDAEARARFRREAQIVARLQHPGIVSVFDYGTFGDGSAFLVMEFVRGEDLRRVLRREGSFRPAHALPLLGSMCAAVHAAHREGVLHRDLKPENILLVESVDAPVKVLDFGVAKVVADRSADTTALGTLTGVGVIVGTPAYMAPEQLRGEPVDARTDVFSLGVIAYEMLTGDLPFGRASLWDIGLRQAEGMKPIQTPHGNVAPHVESAIGQALKVDPAQRPATAADLAALLAQS